MESKTFEVGGSNIMWVPARVAAQAFLDAAKKHGYEKLVPAPPEGKAALFSAMKRSLLGEQHKLVRDLDEANVDNAYALIDETPLGTALSHREELRVTVNADASLTFDPAFHPRARAIQNLYNDEIQSLPAPYVGRFFAALLKQVGGLRIRPQGGVFWVPDEVAEKIRALDADVRQATGGAVRVVRQNLHADADGVETLVQALTEEINAEAERIEGDITSGKLGSRALRNRAGECSGLAKRIRGFEEMLGVKLDELVKIAESTEASAVGAAMQAEASEAPTPMENVA